MEGKEGSALTIEFFGQLAKDVVVDSQDQLVAWELSLDTKQQKIAVWTSCL